MSTEPAQLIILLDGKLYRSVALSAETLTIGRLPDNGLVLAHPAVGRNHAELRLTATGAQLTDLDSPGGTWVGRQRLLANQPQPLADGESFQVGPFVITFRGAGAPGPALAPGTPAPEPAPLVEAALAPVVAPPAGLDRRGEARPELPPERRSRYLQFLPGIYHDGDQGVNTDPAAMGADPALAGDPRHASSFLNRLLLICETIWEPFEQRQDHLERYFDPRTCPVSFLPWLAGWLGLSVEPYWPEARQRALLSTAMDLYRWRGTSHGLVLVLEVCAGVSAVIAEPPEQPFVIKVVVSSPSGATIDRELVEELIQAHKPAHIGYTLELRP